MNATNQPVTEAELQAGSSAPRVTEEGIEATIASEHYFTAADGVLGAQADHEHLVVPASLGVLTFCVLVLANGFTVVGQSAPASPTNFKPEIGRRLAREDAKRKIWAFEGYVLRNKLGGL